MSAIMYFMLGGIFSYFFGLYAGKKSGYAEGIADGVKAIVDGESVTLYVDAGKIREMEDEGEGYVN
jgi:hypothetical protein